MSDTLLSRFLRYVQVDTQSDETSKTFPSTSGQLVLLEMLKQELSELGAADVQMTRHGYVMASIPAKTRKTRVPAVAFLAHVDTAPDCSGKNVKPIVHRKYNGRVIKFPDKPGLTLDPATSPELRTAIWKRHRDCQRHDVARLRRQIGRRGDHDFGRAVAPGYKAETRTD